MKSGLEAGKPRGQANQASPRWPVCRPQPATYQAFLSPCSHTHTHTHTHRLDFSSSAWHRDLNTNILWEEMSWCWLLDSQIRSPFSNFSKDSRSGKGPPGGGMSLEAGHLEAGPSSATDSLCDHRSTIYPHRDGFYNRKGKSDILYWEEIPARTPRFTQFYKILVEQLLWDAQKPWIWADAPFSWEVHHWGSGRYQNMLHLHPQVYH